MTNQHKNALIFISIVKITEKEKANDLIVLEQNTIGPESPDGRKY